MKLLFTYILGTFVNPHPTFNKINDDDNKLKHSLKIMAFVFLVIFISSIIKIVMDTKEFISLFDNIYTFFVRFYVFLMISFFTFLGYLIGIAFDSFLVQFISQKMDGKGSFRECFIINSFVRLPTVLLLYVLKILYSELSIKYHLYINAISYAKYFWFLILFIIGIKVVQKFSWIRAIILGLSISIPITLLVILLRYSLKLLQEGLK